MTALGDVLAQDVPVRTLRRAIDRDRLASAYLFEGPGGVGKQLTALALAEEVVARGDEKVARRIREGKHPDVRVFPPRDEGNRNIPVEAIRSEILPVAQFAPFEASAAFMIFPEADVSFPEAHPEGANALLKTLEEPRRGVFFVLLSERPDRLLPTIRSRCQRVKFARLPNDVVDTILARAGIVDAERAAPVALAGGRADRALELASGGSGNVVLDLALAVDAATENAGPGELVLRAEELAKSPQLGLALETLAAFYRDVAAAGLGLGDDELVLVKAIERVRARSETLSPDRASARLELLRQLGYDLEGNANPEIGLDALLFRLRASG